MAGKARLIALAVLAIAVGSCTDTMAPSLDPPTDVTVTMVSASSARITWSPPAFPDLVINYNIFRDGTKIGESTTTFFVDAGLVQGTVYKYRVSAHGVQGLESEQSAESPASMITVPDVTPPLITATSPTAGATGVSRAATVTATFNKPIDPSTIGVSSFLVTGNGASIPGTVTYTAATRTAEFRPSGALPNAATIAVRITTDVEDVAGNRLAADFSFAFSTRDEVPPTVASTSPAAGAAGVSANTQVTVTFSKPVDQATLSTTSFSLAATGGAGVAGSVSYVAGSNTAVFTPSSPLSFGASYTANVSTAIRDVAGNSLVAPLSWSFTTTSAPDVTPPTVISTSPPSGAVNVGLSIAVSATFSEPMLASSLDGSSVILRVTGTGAQVAGTVAYDAGTNTVTLTPSAPLAGNTSYTAAITTGARDLSGNPLAAAVTWSFSTLDNSPPNVISVSPTSGAVGVAVGSAVTVTFNKPMDGSSISAATISLRNNSTLAQVSGTVSYVGATNTAIFTPAAALAFSTGYTLTVTTGARDASGNTLAAPFTSSFTTASAGDTTPPTVIATVPANGATNVAVGATIGVVFSEPIDRSSIDGNSLKLIVTATGASVAGFTDYNAANNTGVFAPSAPLSNNTGYTIVVSTGVRDLAGNALAATFTASFTTAPPSDTTPPNVIATSPSSGTVGVLVNSSVTVTFSEPMNQATINTSTIIVKEVPTNVVVSGTVTYDPGTKTATFTPSGSMSFDVQYSITVTTSATDLAGNGLATNFSSTFNTIQYVGSPYFQGTDVNDQIHFHITFNQTVEGGRSISLGPSCPPLPQAYCEVFPLNQAGADAIGPPSANQNGGALITALTGTFNDPNFTFTITLENGRTFTYTGTVTGSNKMVGTISGATLRAVSLTLTR